MHHDAEGLFKGVGNRHDGPEHVLETSLDQLRHGQRMVDRLGDPHRHLDNSGVTIS